MNQRPTQASPAPTTQPRKMQPARGEHALTMPVDGLDAGMNPFRIGQHRPGPFEIERLRQPFEETEQALALGEDESRGGQRGDRYAGDQPRPD